MDTIPWHSHQDGLSLFFFAQNSENDYTLTNALKLFSVLAVAPLTLGKVAFLRIS